MLVQAILIALWTAVCTFDLFTFQISLWRPLVAGSVTGLILGDFTQGLIISATLELMWLGVAGIGAYVPPDVVTGSILGTAIGILTGEQVVASVAIAVPVAVMVQQLDVLARTIAVYFTHKADNAALDGDFDKAGKYHLRCLPLFLLTRAIPVFLAVYFGAGHVTKIFEAVPEIILNGLRVSGGILPALGFGLLLSLMLNKKLWIFLMLGFVLSVYMKIPTIGLAMVGIVFAVLYDRFSRGQAQSDPAENSEAVQDGGYDL